MNSCTHDCVRTDGLVDIDTPQWLPKSPRERKFADCQVARNSRRVPSQQRSQRKKLQESYFGPLEARGILVRIVGRRVPAASECHIGRDRRLYRLCGGLIESENTNLGVQILGARIEVEGADVSNARVDASGQSSTNSAASLAIMSLGKLFRTRPSARRDSRT